MPLGLGRGGWQWDGGQWEIGREGHCEMTRRSPQGVSGEGGHIQVCHLNVIVRIPRRFPSAAFPVSSRDGVIGGRRGAVDPSWRSTPDACRTVPIPIALTIQSTTPGPTKVSRGMGWVAHTHTASPTGKEVPPSNSICFRFTTAAEQVTIEILKLLERKQKRSHSLSSVPFVTENCPRPIITFCEIQGKAHWPWTLFHSLCSSKRWLISTDLFSSFLLL